MRALVVILLSVVLLSSCGDSKNQAKNGDEMREYAGALINKSLYQQAVDVYDQYLNEFDIDPQERANVNYIIANTYFERIRDYEKALSYYLKIKHMYPESGFMDEVNKKVVACLERLERTEDAQQALDEAVQMDEGDVRKQRPGEVIARIGEREITQGDLNFELEQLPPSVRNQVMETEQKRQFLREYIATELLYDTAKRAGLDKDPEVIEGTFQAKKSLMVNKLLQQRVSDNVDIDRNDVELYYKANTERYSEKDEDGNIVREKPLNEVFEQVQQDLMRERTMQKYQNMITRMFNSEGVKIYEDRLE
ncbi:MAG: hypothetical protein U5R06_24040 [candidate division KSB1 bacterium]|nr:hypothetical protein [candidate division KSB1 bacterium]